RDAAGERVHVHVVDDAPGLEWCAADGRDELLRQVGGRGGREGEAGGVVALVRLRDRLVGVQRDDNVVGAGCGVPAAADGVPGAGARVAGPPGQVAGVQGDAVHAVA